MAIKFELAFIYIDYREFYNVGHSEFDNNNSFNY